MQPARVEWAREWLRNPPSLYVDGRWHAARGCEREAINPADESRLATLTLAGSADVDQAVAAARSAFDTGPWPRLPRRERQRALVRIGEVVRRHRAELATLITLENGKRLATPLFAVLVLVELTDVLFAVDSVPAVLAVSGEQFIVFTSNA